MIRCNERNVYPSVVESALSSPGGDDVGRRQHLGSCPRRVRACNRIARAGGRQVQQFRMRLSDNDTPRIASRRRALTPWAGAASHGSRVMREGSEELKRSQGALPDAQTQDEASPLRRIPQRTISARQLARHGNMAPRSHDVPGLVQARDRWIPGGTHADGVAAQRCRFCWGREWAHIGGHPTRTGPSQAARPSDSTDGNGGNFVCRAWSVHGRVQPELRRAMQHKYSPREIREIEVIARIMDIGNRGSNTFDAMLSRLRGVPAADSRLFDEVILSGVFLLTAPVVVLVLARASKRPFLEMARSLIDFTKNHGKETSTARTSK
jgi:hypothetical protein